MQPSVNEFLSDFIKQQEFKESVLSASEFAVKPNILFLQRLISNNQLKKMTQANYEYIKRNLLPTLNMIQTELTLKQASLLYLNKTQQELSNKLMILQEKIDSITLFQAYSSDHRKPNLYLNNKKLSELIEYKEKSVQSLKALEQDKSVKRQECIQISKTLENLASSIRETEAECKGLEKILSNREEKKRRLIENPQESDSPIHSKIVSEATAENSEVNKSTPKPKIDKDKQILHQNSLKNIVISADILDNPAQLPKKLPSKHSSLKIHSQKKLDQICVRKVASDEYKSFGQIFKKQMNYKELTRSNQERLAFIENRVKYGDSLHDLLSPAVERLKKIENEKQRGLYSPMSKRFIAEETYRSLSPRV